VSSALILHLPLMQQGKATPHETVQPGPEKHPVPSLLTAAMYCARAVTLMAWPPQQTLGSRTATQSESAVQDWS
jgi:hypothetical protein